MATAPVSHSNVSAGPLDAEELRKIDAYWRASLYLCVGMIFLQENPLLKEPLKMEHIKNRLLGHWGSDPGQTFTWVHLNRLIKKFDLNMIYIAGPGHGAPATLANAYLEGTYSEVYPDRSEDEEGMRNFFKQFSFPGGLGSHAFGAAFDNPDLIVAVMVGDGEAETGPLATAWHSNKFLNPIRDGAVLPILHLNGYKIANPTVLARISPKQLESLFVGYGYKPHFVEGSDPETMHRIMAQTLETVIGEIKKIQHAARTQGITECPEWPMIVLRTPKGWTGPKEVDGHKVEGFWRAHQVPFQIHENPSHLKLLEAWMRSYRPEKLFDKNGRLIAELKALAPAGSRRLSANPVANGGVVRKTLRMPDFRNYAVEVTRPGTTMVENTHLLGVFLRDVMRNNMNNFRVFGPDETASNRLTAIYEATGKTWMAEIKAEDADGGELSPDGRVMEMLSEHTLEGWLEGYLLTGRHGFFASYEAFIHVVDSMFNQHAKWLEKCREISWRAPVSSLNILVTSTVWRQDHNGFSHQDPGFLDVVTNKSAKVTRIYLPPDANCLLSVTDHCLRSVNYVNVVVCDKQLHLQYLDIEGDIPTMEALAATALLRENFPELKIRFINVVDLFKLEPQTEHLHGLSDADFDSLFTADKPIIFNFHGYPWLIHKLAYRRTNHKNLHVRGYKEYGNINTPLELAIGNQIDRFNLAIDVIDRVPGLRAAGAHVKERLKNQIIDNTNHAHEYGIDRPEFTNWKWPY
ncbi:MAG: phosphoketolase family protein [Deltaproteobacteria bacterium]